MKIALFTLTRDRLDYTKDCFAALQEKAGYPYDHFIVDNGSIDGTVEWLLENDHLYKSIIYNYDNKGISIASNQALDRINDTKQYDLIIKMDNDCLVLTQDILAIIVSAYEQLGDLQQSVILSPTVTGIVNPPTIITTQFWGDFKFNIVNHIGGLFHCVPSSIYTKYRYPTELPKAYGQDSNLSHFVIANKLIYFMAYLNRVSVQHYETTDGQARRYPDYFKRKRCEEKEAYNEV